MHMLSITCVNSIDTIYSSLFCLSLRLSVSFALLFLCTSSGKHIFTEEKIRIYSKPTHSIGLTLNPETACYRLSGCISRFDTQTRFTVFGLIVIWKMKREKKNWRNNQNYQPVTEIPHRFVFDKFNFESFSISPSSIGLGQAEAITYVAVCLSNGITYFLVSLINGPSVVHKHREIERNWPISYYRSYKFAIRQSKNLLKSKSINMSIMIWVSMRLQCQSGIKSCLSISLAAHVCVLCALHACRIKTKWKRMPFAKTGDDVETKPIKLKPWRNGWTHFHYTH